MHLVPFRETYLKSALLRCVFCGVLSFMCLSNVPKNRCQLSATGDNVGITHFHITAHWAQYMAYISVPAVSSGSVVQWLERRTFGTKDPNANGSGFKTRQRQHFFFLQNMYLPCLLHSRTWEMHCSTRFNLFHVCFMANGSI